jgi:hypothetical protein
MRNGKTQNALLKNINNGLNMEDHNEAILKMNEFQKNLETYLQSYEDFVNQYLNATYHQCKNNNLLQYSHVTSAVKTFYSKKFREFYVSIQQIRSTIRNYGIILTGLSEKKKTLHPKIIHISNNSLNQKIDNGQSYVKDIYRKISNPEMISQNNFFNKSALTLQQSPGQVPLHNNNSNKTLTIKENQLSICTYLYKLAFNNTLENIADFEPNDKEIQEKMIKSLDDQCNEGNQNLNFR